MSVGAIHTLEIPSWRPSTLNELTKTCSHWGHAARRKAIDRSMVAGYATLAGIPRAAGRRRVGLFVTQPRGAPDPDALWKSTLDALVHCGLLIDDSARWCELGPVGFGKGPLATTITLEEIP